MSNISPRPGTADENEAALLAALEALPINGGYAIVKTGVTTLGQVPIGGGGGASTLADVSSFSIDAIKSTYTLTDDTFVTFITSPTQAGNPNSLMMVFDPINDQVTINANDNPSANGYTKFEVFHDMDVTEPVSTGETASYSISTFRGTYNSPAIVFSGDVIGGFSSYATINTGSGVVFGKFSELRTIIAGSVTGNPGGQFVIYTKQDGGSIMPAIWVDQNQNMGINNANPLTRIHAKGDSSILFEGTFGSGWVEPGLGAGTRMMWYVRKAALRVGQTAGSEWDDVNIGNYSSAFGFTVKASGVGSFAAGQYHTVTGPGDVALGYGGTNSGQGSVTIGTNCTAVSDGAISLGYLCENHGASSIIGGSVIYNTHTYGLALGDNLTLANGFGGFLIGSHLYNHGFSRGGMIADGGSTTTDMTADYQFVSRFSGGHYFLATGTTVASADFYIAPNGTLVATSLASGATAPTTSGALVAVVTDSAGLLSTRPIASIGLFDHHADIGNVGTGEDDLYSDTIAASQLAVNDDKIETEYGGIFVSSGTATREVRAYFGGTKIFDTGALTLSLSSAWTMYITIIRVSATVIRYMVSFTTEGAALAAYTAVGEVTGLTLSSTNILKLTGESAGVGAATNDIVAKMGYVEFKSHA